MHELNAICSVCNNLIADGEGSVWLRSTDLVDAERATRVWEEELRTTPRSAFATSANAGPSDRPAAAGWNVTHTVCAPDTDTPIYSFEVHQCRTWSGLVNWTARLMEKSWLRHTDWAELLRSASRGESSRITPATKPRLGL